MSLLIFTQQKQYIIAEKNRINKLLMDKQKKLVDLQSYASSVGNGSIETRDLLNAPASVFGRMASFMQYSNMSATLGAREKFGFMQTTHALDQFYQGIQAQNSDPAAQQQMMAQTNYMIFSQLRKQELEKCAEREKSILHAQETRMNMEISQLQGRLNMLQAQEDKVSSAEEEACKKSAPSYVA